MHDRLTDVLGTEVVGEVTRVGDSFFDVAMGRVALPDLDRDRITTLLEALRADRAHEIQVFDRLHLQNGDELIRGMVEVSIRAQDSAAPYLLQLTTRPVLALYHRRFLVEPGVLGDLAGVLFRGLAKLVMEGEGPLRVLSRFNEIIGKARDLLQSAIEHSLAGRGFDPAPALSELVGPLREAWRLIPWSLRCGLSPCSRLEQGRIAPHDRVLTRTLLLAAEQTTGKVVYQYVHQHNPLEQYEQVLSWMTEVHQAMLTTYPPPGFAAAIARASEVEPFLSCYPGLRALVGPPLEEQRPDGS